MSGIGLGAGVGFALGSVPFSWLVHRAVTGRDLRLEGSGNPGSTNVHRATGPFWGAAALALDAGKGAAAVLLARAAVGPAAGVAAAVGAVIGHVFTPWLAGRGGRGVAPGAGAFAVVAPVATAVAVGAFVVVVAVTRWVSLGSVVSACVLPVAIVACGPGRAAAVAAGACAAVIAWRHRGNFERMRAGTEPRLGRGARDDGEPER